MTNWKPILLAAAALAAASPLETRQETTCKNVHTKALICGGKGSYANRKASLQDTTEDTLEACRDLCLTDSACVTFDYNTTDHSCRTSKFTIVSQSWKRSRKSTDTFFHRLCWSGSECPTPPPVPVNILQDGDFENVTANNMPDLWTGVGQGSSIASPGRNSDYAMHFSATYDNYIGSFVQDLTEALVPGTYYVLSFDYNICPDSNFYWACGDAYIYPDIEGSNDWYTHTNLIKAIPNQGRYWGIQSSAQSAVASGGATCEMIYDNILIREATASESSTSTLAGASELLVDGDFEGDYSQAWYQRTCRPAGACTIVPGRDGNALQLDGSNSFSGEITFEQDISIPAGPGMDYILSFDYYHDTTNVVQNLFVNFFTPGTADTRGYAQNGMQFVQSLPYASGWSTYTRRFRPTASSLTAQFTFGNGGKLLTLIDNISIKRAA